MKIRGLVEEDFVNYKEPSMFIAFSTCTWKCEQECGIKGLCQNSELAKTPEVDYNDRVLIFRYINNPITKAIVFGGLEPMDSFDEMFEFIKKFRQTEKDILVIYTGYKEEEI